MIQILIHNINFPTNLWGNSMWLKPFDNIRPILDNIRSYPIHLIQDLGNLFVGEDTVRNFMVNTETTKAEMSTMEVSRSKRKTKESGSEKG